MVSRWRRAVLLAVTVAVTACAAACGGATPSKHGHSTTGSAVFVEDGGLLSGFHSDAPATIVFGSSILRNESGIPLTLRGATLHLAVGAASGARLIDARLLDLATTHDLVRVARGNDNRFLPRSVPVEGFRLEPGDQVQVLYVVKVDETGHYLFDQSSVDYTGPYGEGEAVSNFRYEVCPRCRTAAQATRRR